MKSIRVTKVHPLTRILWETTYAQEISLDKFVVGDGLRRFYEPRHENLKDSLRHVASTPCRTYSSDNHCRRCYFAYLTDLPDETHYNCMFDEIFRVIYLPVNDEETKKIKHKITKRVFRKRKKFGKPILELLKDEIFEWCKICLDLELERNPWRTYLADIRNKFGEKNA